MRDIILGNCLGALPPTMAVSAGFNDRLDTFARRGVYEIDRRSARSSNANNSLKGEFL